MKRAIATFGVGKCQAMLNIALPSFKAFAKRHGYDLFVADKTGMARPPAWYKIPMLQTLLADYDEVLWLDSDTVIVDGREDMNVPAEAWQAVVIHKTYEGESPNLGVWLVRKAMLPYLQQAWDLTEYIHHKWWENAAIIDLMGFDPAHPVCPAIPNELLSHTHRLENWWNSTQVDQWAVHPARINHIAACYSNKTEVMAVWAQDALKWMEE